jgi:hypothetical protein
MKLQLIDITGSLSELGPTAPAAAVLSGRRTGFIKRYLKGSDKAERSDVSMASPPGNVGGMAVGGQEESRRNTRKWEDAFCEYHGQR